MDSNSSPSSRNPKRICTATASSSSMDSSNIQSSTSSRRICKYDVFISFRGTDTRYSFVDHLLAHLSRKGLFAFKDDKRLEEGEPISSQLLQAIHDSRVFIVVFSPDYASSKWCLDEMASINECRINLKQTVFPIFYRVDPSDVRHQHGVYGDAFDLHYEKFKQDLSKVNRWQEAMKALGGLVGWDVGNKPEFGEIENIVQAVIKTLGHKFSGFADNLIGIQPRVAELESLLKLSLWDDDFRVLGIWGMDGIGKTTLATVLFDKISYQFPTSCFIDDLSQTYKDGGAIAVQRQILCQTLDEKNLEKYSPSQISGIVRNRLHNIKVLIVLDNVDELEQLQELAINPTLLCSGSRIIITTRDEHILRVYGADIVYEALLMNDNDARQLLCRKAFKREDSSSNFAELIPEILEYAQGLPLAIRVVGSFLCTRNATQWRATLDGLWNNPNKKIIKVLEIGFEGLEQREREIFLHIACFFKGEREDYVKRILDCCGLNPEIGIPLITEKSLITTKNEEIHMHEMLRELGKQIVRQHFSEEPGSWSRLWLHRDFHHVLRTKTGTDKVKAIVLDPKEDVPECPGWIGQGLSQMTSLRLLILYHKNFSASLDFLSNNLRYLLWPSYPFTSLPSEFEPYHLVELNVPNSSIQHLWKGHKDLPHLKRMDLSNSKYLMETPMFEGIPKLERLDFTGCTKLRHIHPSIGRLTKLAFLSLQNCINLVELEFDSDSLSNSSSLRVLHLSGCTNLEKTPDFTGVSNLEYLDMNRCTSLSTVHTSIGALEKLRFLSLRDCTSLVSVPNSVNTMISLITLDLCGCIKLTTLRPFLWNVNFPLEFQSLIHMDVGYCNLSKVPDAIGELRYLERLNLEGNNFVSLPSTTTKLYSLAYLNLARCHQLKHMCNLPSKSDSSVGRYFKTTSGSRDHRSGLYIFDCPKLKNIFPISIVQWLTRLLKERRHFRCGFDIIIPWEWKFFYSATNRILPWWFCHRFNGGSVIRIVHYDVVHNWIGFAFCAAFEKNASICHLIWNWTRLMAQHIFGQSISLGSTAIF
ncbi:disease resistance protein RUN1-like isoform X2 [Gastrolobium bilobum]|uniref:disease resistance protein RUN1-like isoform X2 n=1 Tax=Gastrolobium bilobum TaxID=150636 RepID=UPI002AB0E025|nr:disease resistance protein RUN1-like isoform X2 [Gastrolobium bilobum]